MEREREGVCGEDKAVQCYEVGSINILSSLISLYSTAATTTISFPVWLFSPLSSNTCTPIHLKSALLKEKLCSSH
jgi:hypothetical protein